MTEILLAAILTDNLALSFFLGICTFLAVSQRISTALGLGVAVIVVQGVTVPVNALIHAYLLAPGALHWAGLPEIDLSFLQIIVFIGVIAAMVQLMELLLDRFVPALHRALGVFLPLITVNCAILGGSLFMVERRYDPLEAVVWGIGSGIGWAIAITAFAAIRERRRHADMPEGLQGLGGAFIVTGLMSLGFSGFGGLVP